MTMIRERIDYMTVEEYFAFDDASEIRHEYIDGELYPMDGGTLEHARIIPNTTIALGNRLRQSDCFVVSSAMRIAINPTRYRYADLCVVCGEAERDYAKHSLLNPILAVEVTSPSSMRTDHVAKRDDYARIPSLRDYLILDQYQPLAELHTRQDDGWRYQRFDDISDTIPLPALNIELPLAEVYRGIEF